MRISNKRLTSLDIQKIGKQLSMDVQVYSRDNVPSPLTGQCYVINLDSAGGQGTHWVCFYRIPFPSSKFSEILYCDSFGAPMPEEESQLFLKDHAKVHWNRKQLQALNSTLCGWFCLGFLLHCSMHPPVHPEDDPRDVLVGWQGLFSDNTSNNDKLLRKFFASL
jgi:hypothetical protein